MSTPSTPEPHATGSSAPDGQTSADLADCEQMISYAARHGKPILASDLVTVSAALDAKRQRIWNAHIQGGFYEAMTRISQAVAPATPECFGPRAELAARKTIRVYSAGTFVLAFIVIVVSCALLVMNQINADIAKLVDENDKMAFEMHNELQAHILTVLNVKNGTPASGDELVNSQAALELKQHVQQFATNSRRLFSDVERLGAFESWPWKRHSLAMWNRYVGECDTALQQVSPKLFFYVPNALSPFVGGLNTFAFATPVDLDHKAKNAWLCSPDTIRQVLEIKLPLLRVGSVDQEELAASPRPQVDVQQGFQKIAAYQDIRSMALHLADGVSGIGGSTTAFLLPVLYAWLGACAHILRSLRVQSADNTFHPRHSKVANRSQMATAVIIGITIGLFTNLLEDSKVASPLALAFVAGYASDKFFEFIERVVKAIFPSEGTSPAKK